MAEKTMLEVGGNAYEVSEKFMETFNQMVEKLSEAMPEDVARAKAFELAQLMVSQGMIKKADSPDEIVPDLAELAQPYIDKALEEGRMDAPVNAWLDAVEQFNALLAEHGIPATARVVKDVREYTGFVKLQAETPDDETILMRIYRVKKDSPLANAALAVPVAYRNLSAAVKSVITAVAENEGLEDPNGVSQDITREVDDDGETVVRITLSSTKKRRSGGGGGGGGPRSSYEYSADDQEKVIWRKLSTGGGWTEMVRLPIDADEDTALAAVKEALDATNTTYAKVHWTGSPGNRGRDWWDAFVQGVEAEPPIDDDAAEEDEEEGDDES